MPLCAQDVQAAGLHHGIVLDLRRRLVRGDDFVPLLLRGFELLRLVVEAHETCPRIGLERAFRR